MSFIYRTVVLLVSGSCLNYFTCETKSVSKGIIYKIISVIFIFVSLKFYMFFPLGMTVLLLMCQNGCLHGPMSWVVTNWYQSI